MDGAEVEIEDDLFFFFFLMVEEAFSSVAQSCLILCNPTDCSTSGFPVHRQLPDLAEIHVYRVGDAT